MSYSLYKDLGKTPEELNMNNSGAYKCEVLTTLEQKNRVLQQNKIVCIELFGSWCEPCKVVAPDFTRMALKYNKDNDVYLCTEDVDKGLTPSCTGVPMFVFFHNGQLVKSIVGADMQKIESELLRLIDETTLKRRVVY
jgi:thiol-disulfide isomerase/thioredoxin